MYNRIGKVKEIGKARRTCVKMRICIRPAGKDKIVYTKIGP